MRLNRIMDLEHPVAEGISQSFEGIDARLQTKRKDRKRGYAFESRSLPNWAVWYRPRFQFATDDEWIRLIDRLSRLIVSVLIETFYF